MEVKKICKAGRPRAFDVDAALDRALHVFWRKGYEGTSVSDLTDALGVNRPSLYAAFGNKEQLFRKALDRYAAGPGAYAMAAMDAPTAREALERLLEAGLSMLGDAETPAGCLLVQGALTCSEASDSVRRELSTRRLGGERMLRERFERAVSEGELLATTDCTSLARYYTTVMQGMSVQAATGATPEQMRQVVALALRAWPVESIRTQMRSLKGEDFPPTVTNSAARTIPSGTVKGDERMTEVILIASGDLRASANQKCEPAQAAMEAQVVAALEREGATVRRGHPYVAAKGHGFIDSQKYGMEVFRDIDPHAPLVVAEAVWQYSHHVLPGLSTHKGPILTVANWSGTWPGLVGMLNLNGSLTKAGVAYSTLWSDDFTDDFFTDGLRLWLRDGTVTHDTSHVRPFDPAAAPAEDVQSGVEFAQGLKRNKAIMGIFDEGCMGMYNAIIPDELLHATGVFKERLSQSGLYAKTQTVSDAEARGVYEWLRAEGLTFQFGPDAETDLTEAQVLEQCKMYIAALRIADEFGCDTIGIQYQQGLKDLAPASDLVEGLLNNVHRPPVRHEETGDELYPGAALPHFNEVDECAGLDALVTNRLWTQMGLPPETTLHDLRWGRRYQNDNLDAYVWVFEISGAAPPEHFIGGYAGASSERQPPMYFRLGGGTLKGVSKPGHIVWSRVFVEDGALKFDTGLGEVVALPDAETKERLDLTTPQWPIMHAVLSGVTRDQMMARHKANHIQVAYAPDRETARRALHAKAAAMQELGLQVALCGEV